MASFSCRVIGEPTPELTWQLNGQPLTIEGRYTVVERDGLQLLQVHDVVASDTGEYMAIATNILGEDTCCAKMTVEGRLTFLQLPSCRNLVILLNIHLYSVLLRIAASICFTSPIHRIVSAVFPLVFCQSEHCLIIHCICLLPMDISYHAYQTLK